MSKEGLSGHFGPRRGTADRRNAAPSTPCGSRAFSGRPWLGPAPWPYDGASSAAAHDLV